MKKFLLIIIALAALAVASEAQAFHRFGVGRGVVVNRGFGVGYGGAVVNRGFVHPWSSRSVVQPRVFVNHGFVGNGFGYGVNRGFAVGVHPGFNAGFGYGAGFAAPVQVVHPNVGFGVGFGY